jgi:hypothetical protein
MTAQTDNSKMRPRFSRMITETFFLVAEKRSLRTQTFQDLWLPVRAAEILVDNSKKRGALSGRNYYAA